MNTIKTFKGLSAGFALSMLLQTTGHAQEIIVDNIVGPKFSVSGTWTASTATGGYTGPNYLTHTAGTEYVGHAILDNGGSGTHSVGSWSNSVSSSGYYGSNYQAAPAGSGQSTYTWNIGGALTQAGTYNVYARWTSATNRADNATYTLTVNGTPSQISVNQKQGGGQWNLLGTYSLVPGQTSISLSNQANGYVIADAIQVMPVNAQVAHTLWMPQVSQTGWYDVYVRWTAASNRATNAPYTVQHADGQSTLTVNQRLNGGQWRLLGNYKLNGSSTIRLSSENTDGYVIADGVRLVLTQADTAAQAYYIHSDHLNTPRIVTDSSNVAVWRSLPTTEPFGDAAPEEDPNSIGTSFKFNLRFPGQYFDKETNTSYNYFRDYDPSIGRYVQSDPIGLGGGINTYSYVGAAPLDYADPDGKSRTRPSWRPVNNAQEAAGYHDPQGEFYCRQWSCPQSPYACGKNDIKRPTDFMPPAYSSVKGNEPTGCICVSLGYRQSFNLPMTTDPIDAAGSLGNMYDMRGAEKRILPSMSPMPYFSR